MELEPIIGLEIHVQLKTATKMFCSCANIFGDVEPNSAICPICLGYPGTLPVPNAHAIQWIQRAGAALQCELALQSKFDRKSYFYPDLPKGYQISQFDQPFCGEGELEIVVEEGIRKIGIERIHLEEDAAKNIHDAAAKHTLIDYNRAGTPLIELVTKPDLRTPAEARVFLQELQQIIRTLKISDADMEKGQLRCDANISLRPVGEEKLYPKTEVKNINSFRNVERALQHEITRQQALWEKGEAPTQQSTRGFNADTNKTIAQRTKEEAADYRYFPEPDIPPFVFTAEDIAAITQSIPELPAAKRDRFQREYNASGQEAALLVADDRLAHFFEATMSELQQLDAEQVAIAPKEIPALAKQATNIILRQFRDLLMQNELAYEEVNITSANFAELVVLVGQGKVNKNALSEILAEMQATGGDPDPIIAKLGVAQVDDTAVLNEAVRDVITANPDVVAKIKAGKDSALQFLMGQVMAKTKGRANPDTVIILLRKAIND